MQNTINGHEFTHAFRQGEILIFKLKDPHALTHPSARRIKDGVIREVSFIGKGCAISKASASLMTEALKGKSEGDAELLFTKFHDLLTGPPDVKADGKGLGKLAVFSGVREFPVRVKCATLAWHTLRQALAGSPTVASTEGGDPEAGG